MLEIGIGGGKSFELAALLLYPVYKLIHRQIILKQDPRPHYGLDPGTLISIATVSVRADQAKKVVFGYCLDMISKSPWFREYAPWNPAKKSSLEFKAGYEIFPGHSHQSSVIGLQLHTCCIDEANYFMRPDTSGIDYAREMHDAIEGRILSRFGRAGFLGIISSRRTVDDFTARRIAEVQRSKELQKEIYTVSAKATWDRWPEEPAPGAEGNPKVKTKCKWRAYDADTADWCGEQMAWEEAKATPLVGNKGYVPDIFWTSAEANPEQFLRDHQSVPAEALEPFFRNPACITWGPKPNPVRKRVKPTDWLVKPFSDLFAEHFYGASDQRYAIHVDLALGRRDACGFCMGHQGGWSEVAQGDFATHEEVRRRERAPRIDIDCALSIRAPARAEIIFSRIRELIFWLRDDRLFKIAMVTYDGWQSVDSRQILQSRGVHSELLSLDRALGANYIHAARGQKADATAGYNTLKTAMNEGRVTLPAPWVPEECQDGEGLKLWADRGDPVALLCTELRRLELVNGKKVDHPPNYSKDVSDAVAGVVCTISAGKAGGVSWGKIKSA